MSQNLIIFDLDGTLANTGLDLIATLNRVTNPHGVAPMEVETLNYVLGQGARAMITRSFERHGIDLPKELEDNLFQEFLEDYEANICNETHLFDGVLDAMEQLDKDGYSFAVCTNKSERLAKLLLDKLEVTERFAALTGGDTFEFKKPDARHLEETAKLANGKLEHSIMIGDSKSDIGAALNAGIPSVAVTFGYSDIPAAQLGATKLIDNFGALPAVIREIVS